MPLTLRDQTGVTAHYLARFSGLNPQPGWLHELRQQAFARFAEVGFPGRRTEGWRQTNLAPIVETNFAVQAVPPPMELVPQLRGLDLPGVDWSPEAVRLVFVNGQFAPGLSSTSAQATGELTERWLPHLTHDDECEQGFVQLNTAFLTDAALIEVPAGMAIERPISILHLTTGSAEAKGASYPRTVILAGRESQVRVVETSAGLDGGVYFTNAVASIEVGENAAVEYTRIGQDAAGAFHLSKLRSRQARDSRLTAHSISLGGALTRNNVHAILDGENALCTLNGLFALSGAQHVDNSTVLDHAQPLGTSREYYKGILDQKAVGVFNGRIIVRPDAQHTDAIQSNKNLLLSDSAATVNAQPQLEIYADDVRCTHGATVGQLDPTALFYLRSRGLGLEESRKLLIYAFAADVLGRVQSPELRQNLEALLWSKWAE